MARGLGQLLPCRRPSAPRTQIPETTPVGTVLNTFTCSDPDSPGSTLDYQLPFRGLPGPGSECHVDCDTPGACFQLAASILVLDDGQPLMTSEVPVLVMVTPVNKFSPACVSSTFRNREDAGPPTLLGSVVGTDMDYPHDSIEYYTSGGSATFAVDHLSGEVCLLGPLDYELQRLYRLTVLLTDHSQDQDPTCRGSGSCTITIEVEDVNNHALECEPPFQELTIHTPLGRSVEVTKVSCRVPQEPQHLAFSYSIVGGEGHGGHQAVGEGQTKASNCPLLLPPCFQGIVRADSVCKEPSWSLHPPPQHHSHCHCASSSLEGQHSGHQHTQSHSAFNDDTPVCDRHGGFLAARALVCGGADSDQCPSPLGSGMAPQQAPWGIQGTERSIEVFMEAPRMEMTQAPSSIISLRVKKNLYYFCNSLLSLMLSCRMPLEQVLSGLQLSDLSELSEVLPSGL
ncbi:hypothetical protein HPG69_012790 [Diceros bicornis minor]|uniref:Cadherin domain-containing protein n=1 Tax=Diceros bicornis minor TaxID=77932 RepID=A0A7J7F0R2_DICBM|nr:hypothetical protein HPG69_012790 [Diceros bicornis minor]